MANLLSLKTLISAATAESLLQRALDVAEAVGLPVTSWRAGDPTRSIFQFLAEVLATLEETVVLYIGSGFLEYAEGQWLTVVAKQTYNVDRIKATYASGSLTLLNSGGGLYVWEPGDLTFKSTASNKTFHNTTGGTLNPSGTLTLSWEADEPGSDSSVIEDEIDDLVTSYIGVTVPSSTASTALDEETDEALRIRCRESLGPLSPAGPADAYSYVAKNADLTGITTITRVRVVPNSSTGDVTVYVGTPDGEASEDERTAVENAIAQWAAPLCITPEVLSIEEFPVDVELSVDLWESVGLDTGEIADQIEAALNEFFGTLPVGGEDGHLHRSRIAQVVFDLYPGQVVDVTVAVPAADVALSASQVPVLQDYDPDVDLVEAD